MKTINVFLVPKENLKQSFIKDLITFSFLLLSIYVSYGSNFWTFITGILFLVFMSCKLAAIIEQNNNKFTNKEEAINYINKHYD